MFHCNVFAVGGNQHLLTFDDRHAGAAPFTVARLSFPPVDAAPKKDKDHQKNGVYPVQSSVLMMITLILPMIITMTMRIL